MKKILKNLLESVLWNPKNKFRREFYHPLTVLIFFSSGLFGIIVQGVANYPKANGSLNMDSKRNMQQKIKMNWGAMVVVCDKNTFSNCFFYHLFMI